MRLAVCALSAVLMSGCSWLGGGFGGNGHSQYSKSSQHGAQYGAQQRGQNGPCVVRSPQAPIPYGCDPASVTLATAGGFPQQPNFGGGYGEQASGGYGSHAGVAGQQAAHYQPKKSLRKPKLRGSMSLGLEKSYSGDFLDYSKVPSLDPALLYDPTDYNEGFSAGSPIAGERVDTTYTAVIENISKPSIAFDDVHSTPLSLKGGLEYIMTPRTTVFANAGYAYSEGKSFQAVGIDAELRRQVRTRTYQNIPATDGSPAVPATPTTPEIPAVPATAASYLEVSDITNTTFIPNENIANYTYDFTDQNRIDLEVGARHYFNPIMKNQGYKTLTPFLGASVGATHHNAVAFDIGQDQRYLQRAFDEGLNDYYQVVPSNVNGSSRVELYDSQWVPSGQLNAGMEWQVTPKTALAFETGVRVEGARKYSHGGKGDKNIAIPMTIRGSYNF